jgi:hypothetical protein
MLRLRDHQRRPNANDARRLTQDDLDAARILVAGNLERTLRRFDITERDDASLRLRHDLLRERDDVAVLELDGVGDERREVVPFSDLRQAGDGNDPKLFSQGSP